MNGGPAGELPEEDGGFRDGALSDEPFLISQVVGGERNMFRILIERHERAVYGMGLSFFHNAEDAADFVQEVFLKAYRNLAHFEGKARFSTWLYRIAWNTALNGVTRAKDWQSLAGDDFPEGAKIVSAGLALNPEEALLREASRQAVLAAVQELPENQKACVDLFFFYDRSLKEIEAITGFPENTVKSHVHRAKKILREKLKHLNEV
jgi:RNA polymerase sigma-70 factor (ECF subfamily)